MFKQINAVETKKQQIQLKNRYLELIKNKNILPNFFVSEAYLSQIDFKWVNFQDWIWVEDSTGLCIIPPIHPIKTNDFPVKNIWAGFVNYPSKEKEWDVEFFDWQYIFNPSDFINMSGGRWETYRKNSKKWNQHKTIQISQEFNPDTDLLADFVELRKQNFMDVEWAIECFLNADLPVFRQYIYENSELKAVNIWDENHKLINYRWCFCRNEPFLSEFARLCFYRQPQILNSDKLVNDGGSLGFSGLETFKDKMNPEAKYKIFTFKK
jgi:hypothetical protein